MPSAESHIFDITRVISLAIAPVFLLSAIGTIINALTARLARAVDRRRVVEEKLENPKVDSHHRDSMLGELRLLARRIMLVLWAIGAAVFSALLICILIGTAFMGAFTSLDLSRTVAIVFLAAVVALTLCLVLFMREVFLAVSSIDQFGTVHLGTERELRTKEIAAPKYAKASTASIPASRAESPPSV
jgi:voltage-gated potassium channel Kch